jgi:hypothetical protein
MPALLAGARATEPGLIEYGGLLLGRNQAAGIVTPYRLTSLEGWEDTPGIDSGTVPRSGSHGGWPGRLLAQTRTVTATFRVDGGANMAGVVGGLNAATSPVEDTEQPLTICLDERGPLLVYARVLRRSLPVTRTWRVGVVAEAAIQWEASDPRRYETVEHSAQTALPQPETGLDWEPDGLTWPLDWGESLSTGNTTPVNRGDATTHPVIEFHGPVTMPSVTNLSSGDVLEYDITLSAADILTVDTWAGTVLLNGGVSRLYTATLRSVPEGQFTLPPGASTLAFRHGAGTLDPAATCTIRWRSAFW